MLWLILLYSSKFSKAKILVKGITKKVFFTKISTMQCVNHEEIEEAGPSFSYENFNSQKFGAILWYMRLALVGTLSALSHMARGSTALPLPQLQLAVSIGSIVCCLYCREGCHR